MGALKRFKKVFLKVFGKAKWFLIVNLISAAILAAGLFVPVFSPYIETVSDENGSPVRKFTPEQISCFSTNDNGTSIFLSNAGNLGIAGGFNIDTKEQTFATVTGITTDVLNNKIIYPYNLVITDDNTIYGIKFRRNEGNLLYQNETIVRLSADYRYLGDVCTFEYDQSQRMRTSKLSRLHYYNGAVTFAETTMDSVVLYSIDTQSEVLTKSDPYPASPDGTFTIRVIPLDESFLFIQSDGNVYKTGFNEPLGEPVCRFDMNVTGKSDTPCFDQAVTVNGKLYVADTNSGSLFLIENGEFKRLTDICGENDKIVALDSYRPSASSEEVLVICLKSGIMTYTDGGAVKQDVELKIDQPVLRYIYEVAELIWTITLICLGIHLLTRRKTLLYKQLAVIIPVFIALTAAVAVKAYYYYDEQIASRINRELTIVAELGKIEFSGYDFSNLLAINEDTGSTYRDVADKLNSISSDPENDWSTDYVFSIVYQSDNGDMVLLAGNSTVYVPMQYNIGSFFNEDHAKKEDLVVDSKITSFFADDYNETKIAVMGRIKDADDTGRYYLRVSSDISSLFTKRSDIFFKVLIYASLVLLTLITIIVLSMLNTVRIMKKATKTVKKISEGDLSARVNYKSKDELGEICKQVNEMGQSLETLFAEKDETEKFYYKFVPEKFRELLGKEKFTDLTLGDAKSCELTVLFCDIRSFSINSEMMTAKENFSFVNVIYGKMGPIVRANNGFVDKYIGDAVMALFENADDAIRCGIEMYKAIVLDPKTAEELNISDINIGIGIHSGMAMAGIVGESERLSGTVISDTVNLSSRLESLTKQYKTAMLVSKETIDRLADPDSLNVRYLGMVQVAGVNEVKAVYEVLDCLPEDQRTLREGNNSELREAIRLFSLGRRSEAASALQNIKDSGKNDYVTDMYLDYIRNMSDDDKANVFRFVRK